MTAVFRSLLENPLQMTKMFGVALDTARAFMALKRHRDKFGPHFAARSCPTK